MVCIQFDCYQDGVGERSESGVKAGKRKLYSVQFSRRGRLRRAWLWEPEWEQMIKVICFLFALTNLWFVYSLTVNQDGVGERAEIIQSLSQLRWQLSLPKRALLFVRFKMPIYNWTSISKRADFIENYRFIGFLSTPLLATPTPSLYQREPMMCCISWI